MHHVRFPAVALGGYKQQVKYFHLGEKEASAQALSKQKSAVQMTRAEERTIQNVLQQGCAYFTDAAVVCRLALGPPVPHQLLPGTQQQLPLHLTLLQSAQQTIPKKQIQTYGKFMRTDTYTIKKKNNFYRLLLDHLKKLVIRHFNVPGHVPREVDHGNDGLDALQFVPLVALHCQLVLMG